MGTEKHTIVNVYQFPWQQVAMLHIFDMITDHTFVCSFI